MMTGPIALTDAQLAAIADLSQLIPPWRRGEYLEALALRLRGVEIGDGNLHTIAAATMREVLARARLPRWTCGGGEEG